MIISRFNISRLRNEEWFRFHTEYSGLAEECGVEFLELQRIYPLYKARYKEGDQLLELLRASFVTPDTTEANRNREKVFRGLRDAAKSLLNTLDPAKLEAAAKVYAVTRKYNDVISKGTLGAKTAAIDNLLQDLTPGEGAVDLSAEVQLLGFGFWVTDLATANQAYKQALAERTGEEAVRPAAGRLPQVRAEVDHYYLHMINVIDARLLTVPDVEGGEEEDEDPPSPPVEGRDTPATDPEEKLRLFAHSLNACIARWKAILKGRRTRSEKKLPEEDDSPKEG
jgi:hypothetical protein